MNVFETAKQIKTIQLAERYTKMTKKIKYWEGKCPVHEDKHPSFVIYANTGVWQCLSCGIFGSDSIALLSAIKGIGLYEAAKQIITDFGLDDSKTQKKYNFVTNECPYENYIQLWAIDLFKEAKKQLSYYKYPWQQDNRFYFLMEICQLLDILSEVRTVKRNEPE